MAEQISRYSLYSESPSEADPELVHIETIHARANLFDWNINIHKHPSMFQIIAILRGGALVHMDGQQSIHEGPCFITIPMGVVHGFEFHKDTVGFVVTVAQLVLQDEQFIQRFPMQQQLLSQAYIQTMSANDEDLPFIEATLQALADEYEQQQMGKQAMFAWLFYSLLLKLGRRLLVAETAGKSGSHEQRFQRLKQLIDCNFRLHWTVKEYAEALNTTPMSLSRTCKAMGAEPVNQLQQDRLLLEAQRMLIYTSAAAAVIAYDLGFKDPAYFSRFFKRRTGLSPQAFRVQRET